MTVSAARWIVVTPSEFPWEREALDFLRERLPDGEPYVAFTNFEFIADDGSINEVDLLILTPRGLFLVEIKSRPGAIDGDAGTWTWTHEGKLTTVDSPLILANRKARKLASLLRRQKAFQQCQFPYLEAIVFCSAPGLKLRLDERARQGVYLREPPSIVEALTNLPVDSESGRRARIDRVTSRALGRAMEQVGIRRAQKYRRVGDYVLGKLLFEGPGYQDWEAEHATVKSKRRVRLYPLAAATSALSRETIRRAAQREFQILEGIRHDGILRAVDYKEHELGPALIFEHDPTAVRLDFYLRENAARLGIEQRLALLRKIAETVKYAHQKRLVHRALSPQSILVLEAASSSPRVQIFNWQTGRRGPDSAASGIGITPTTNLSDLVEDAATVYIAPEALRDPRSEGETLDVFSMGALAYHLFSGQRPAVTALELGEKLREGRGLRLSAVLDGASDDMQLLVQYATDPDLLTRLASMDDFLVQLADVEKELRSREEERWPDPIEANEGDKLQGGFTVIKRLGKGASAVALLVKLGDADEELVLKVALSQEHNDRLRGEGEVLTKLRHQHVCELRSVIEVSGRVALLMKKAGDQTLARRISVEGRIQPELLERFGIDLLETVDWLEQQGIPHRDIKPDNIGVMPVGRGDKLHLVLFDFSLSRAPAENIRAGTVPYLDPFLPLRKPPRWDLFAERFAAAMTLHEMATGTLPSWGGGSDPALVNDEVTLETHRFDPDLRDAMAAFFRQALARDYRARFGNTENMLRAWREIFASAEHEKAVSEHGEAPGLGDAIQQATRETPLAVLGLSTRAINALDRSNLVSVRDLLSVPAAHFSRMRGVGSKTRRELATLIAGLAKRFPREEVPEAAPTPPAPVEPPTELFEAEANSVDLIAQSLAPAPRGRAKSEDRVLRILLGREDEAGDAAASSWHSQTEVADRLGLTRARVGQIVASARARWGKSPAITRVRNDIAGLVESQGGVVTAAALASAVLTTRGSMYDEPRRTRLATAVTRAAVETERAREEPRFQLRRVGDVVLVAQSQDLADYAERLGKVADRLAEEDPLPTPARVVDALQRVKPPEGGVAFPPNRLVATAASVSGRAAAGSRLEIYPKGMDALRALKLAHGSLLGARQLTVDQLRERVASRFPESQPLPGRPVLDDLLREAGWRFEWKPDLASGQGAYQSHIPGPASLSSSTSFPASRSTSVPDDLEVTAEVADARVFQAKLQYAYEHGGFLALTVRPKRLADAERELKSRFVLDRRSLEEMLIRRMKEEAAKSKAEWRVVLNADAAPRTSPEWRNLMFLVGRATPSVETELREAKRPILLVYPGLLARYDQLGMLERLRDIVGRPGGPPGLWVLIPSDELHARPVMDGRPMPVITPGQWARIPESWIESLHRAEGVVAPLPPHGSGGSPTPPVHP